MTKLRKTRRDIGDNNESTSIISDIEDFTLFDDDLDRIVGGMNSGDLQEVMQLAATDMGLDTFTPTSYFE